MQISVWEKESFYGPKDIIIIGSGLVGLWSAYCLKKKHPKLQITIAERGLIPTGASTRNAGFACFGSLTELLADREKMGEGKMLQLVTMRYAGLGKIRKVFSSKEIGFDRCGGYELISSRQPSGQLEEQINGMNRLLKAPIRDKQVFRLADKKIARFGFTGISHLVGNKLEASLHSGKLCQALLRLVQSMGVTVLNGLEITGMEKAGNNIILQTIQQLELAAAKVLVCTNAFAKQLLPALDLVPARGQVILTSPIDDLTFKGTFHYDEGYYYFRNIGNRVLLGGARNSAFEAETTTEMQTTENIQMKLEHFLSNYLLSGKSYTITDRWSGIMGMGSEKMPIIQEVTPGVFCAVRMHGMGVALAPIAGEKVAKMME